jgi:putative flippase GtrA
MTISEALSTNVNVQFVRYAFASALALGVDIGFLWACTEWLNYHYLLSATVGFIAGVSVNYLMCVSWVFRERNFNNPSAEFAVFISIGLCGLAISSGSLWLLTEIMDIYYLASKMMATIWVFLFNYMFRKHLLFTCYRRYAVQASARSLSPTSEGL